MFIQYYQTLGLTPHCTEKELRSRYLELVRQYSPESNPEKFSIIHNAYEKLKNLLKNISEELFQVDLDDSFERVIQSVIEDVRSERLPTTLLLKMGET
ncbi:MAG: J domain-containing protein [Planctomycetaceae bacterium]|jgi:hypothetical protein|nr:J domain-containing protein [Planctomycetaceae bacterium]